MTAWTWPSRDTLPGIGIYYLTLALFILASVHAWQSRGVAAAALVAAALAFLLLQDVKWLKDSHMAPQDRMLIERITAMLEDPPTRELLREYDFEKFSVSERSLEKLEEIRREWEGVDFEFQDPECERVWREMQGQIARLLDILREHGKYFNAHNFSLSQSGRGGAANRARDGVYRRYQLLRRVYISKMPYL